MKERFKAIFLDWNGTLSNNEFFDHLRDSNNPNTHLRELLERTLNDELWPTLAKPWMRGDLRTEDIARAISEKSGIPYETVFSEIVEGSKKMQIDKEVLELVSQIRETGTKVLIATGNVDAFDRWTVPALDLENKFDGILNSYSLRALKKDRDEDGGSLFFKDYLMANGLSPEECVIIDDMQDDEGIIESFGMKFVKLTNNENLADELQTILADLT